MLVLRSWLTNYGARRARLKHLIGLAPATLGSPLAHKGRGILGSIFKGNHDSLIPDFLNAGDQVLDALELGSRFTWDLAERDLLADPPFYTKDDKTPYVAVFIGDTPYSGMRKVVDEPATDGTVRWAGAALNTRKIIVNLARNPGGGILQSSVEMTDFADGRLDIPMIGVPGANHATILSHAENTKSNGLVLADLVAYFIQNVNSEAAYATWIPDLWGASYPKNECFRERPAKKGWQHFVTRANDEKGNPISDYSITLSFKKDGPEKTLQDFEEDLHAYRTDPSYRCFHVNLPEEVLNVLNETNQGNNDDGANGNAKLYVRINASTGTQLLKYQPYDREENPLPVDPDNGEILLDISDMLSSTSRLFFPYTTTMLEIRISRETAPIDNVSTLLYFIKGQELPEDEDQQGRTSD